MAKFFGLFGFISKKGVPYGTVTYEVTGEPGSFNITYSCPKLKTQQILNVSTGWQYSFIGNEGDYYYLAAQANNRNAKVNVKLYQNGKVIDENSKTGDFVLALLSGSLKQ